MGYVAEFDADLCNDNSVSDSTIELYTGFGKDTLFVNLSISDLCIADGDLVADDADRQDKGSWIAEQGKPSAFVCVDECINAWYGIFFGYAKIATLVFDVLCRLWSRGGNIDAHQCQVENIGTCRRRVDDIGNVDATE